MNTNIMLDFLAALGENNDREWFHSHKAQYKAASEEFEMLVGELKSRIGEFDGSVLRYAPKELTFKLMRDTRFSHDKSPYNPTFRAHISSMGKLPIPVGYYIMIKPNGGTFLGGGLFADMFANATAMVRDYISAHPDEWNEIITNDGFKRHFTVKGNALKNVPAGYPKDHPQAEYLKYKSWFTEYFVPDATVRDGERFVDEAVEIFRAVKPFNDFLNIALKDFKMPAR